MKSAAVVCDNWKLPTFKKHLDAAGYSYTEHPGFTARATVLKVAFEWVHKLKPVIEAAERECRKKRARHV